MKRTHEVLASLRLFWLDDPGRHSNFNTTRDIPKSDPNALSEVSRLANSAIGIEDAKRLWNELSRTSQLSKISREDLARLESLTGARR